jgi:hypothetical protein
MTAATAKIIRGPWTVETQKLNQFTAQINKDIRDFNLTGSFTAADVQRIADRAEDADTDLLAKSLDDLQLT